MPIYNLSTNRYQTLPAATPVYDANGNLTADGFHNYAWDAEGRTVTIDSGTFTYDALDRRLDFGASGSYQQYFYPPFDLNYNFGQAVGSAGQLGLRVPTPGGGQVNMTPSGVSAYRHPNWQGSQVVNSTTTRTAAADNAFTPFGERYAIKGYSGYFAGMLMQYPYMTDGYQADERLYHDGQGRWVSPDPAGLGAVDLTNPQSLNRYVYVMNDPLNNVDPSGLMRNCPSGDGCQPSTNQLYVFTTCAQAALAYPQQVTCGGGNNQFFGPGYGGNSGSGTGLASSVLAPSEAALNFLASCEGFSPTAYLDSRGNCTIGYGHLLHRGACNASDNSLNIAQPRALSQFAADSNSAVAALNNALSVPLTQSQYDAMFSLTFNMGMARLQRHDVWRDVNAGNAAAAPRDILSLSGGGPGIPTRRANEANMFSNGVYANACYAHP